MNRALRFSTVAKQFFCLAFSVFFLAGASFAQSQSNAADLSGTVTDQTGAVVTNATVIVKNQSINISRTATTDGAGFYQIINLPPGSYQITVEATTFKKAVFNAVQLTVGQGAQLDVKLEIGQQSAEVTIEGSNVDLVETGKTSVSTTIDQQKIENLPINQRDYLGFTLTTSNIGRDNGRPIGPAPTSGLNIGGSRGRSSLVQVDGADNTDNSINAARSTVSQEAVQEFQVVTNSFAPEFGRSAGGIVNVVTKRGTNKFTGNVFGFLRDKSIQARNAFSPVDNADFRRTQFGATLGGRIIKDKTFFFAAYEGRRRDETGFFTADVVKNLTASTTIQQIIAPTPGGNVTIVPTAQTFSRLNSAQVAFINGSITQGLALLGSATTFNQGVAAICGARAYAYFASSGGNNGLSGLSGLGNPNLGGSICPAITPIVPTATDLTLGTRFLLSGAPIPVGTRDANGNAIAFRPLLDLAKSFPVTDNTNFSSFRFDQNINENNQLNFRFGYNNSKIEGIQVESQNQSLGQNDVSRTGVTDFKDTSFQTNLISTYGNSVNEFKFAYSKRKARFFSQINDAVAFNIADTAYIGRELFSPVDRTENRFQFADNFTHVLGNHTLKFGADFNFVDIPEALFELDFAGLYNFGTLSASNFGFPANAPVFTPVQTYGLGLPSNFIQGFSNSRSKLKNKPFAFFGQDSWKISRNFTLNYGLRYDIEFTQQFGTSAFRDPLSGISLSEADVLAAQDVIGVTQGFPKDKNNFAPRIAAAWDITGDAKNVVRGAFGLFYDHPALTIGFNSDLTDSAQQQQAILITGSPAPTALLNAAQVFQGTVCIPGGANPVCPAGVTTPGVATSAIYQFGRQRFDPTKFIGYSAVLPFSLPISKDFKYGSAVQANLAYERQLTKMTTLSVTYLYTKSSNLPRPSELNQPRTDLQIQNFQRFANRLPGSQTEAIGNISIATTAPGSAFTNAYGVTCAVVIPGMIGQCPNGRVIVPAIANFFRPNAPNYFLAAALSGGAVSKAVLDSQLAGSLRTPGLTTPFGAVNAQVSDGNSSYNGLTLDYKGRLTRNSQFLVSYTWSHTIDDSSDLQTLLVPQSPTDLSLERGNSLFDQRHRFVFSGLASSPDEWRTSDTFAKKFFSDFTVSTIVEIASGKPFNIITNFDSNNDQSTSTDRPGVKSDGTLCLPDQPVTAAPIGSPCSIFRQNSAGALVFNIGNLGRNAGLTKPFSSIDLRITRAIRFGERVKLDLIAEGFNMFNRFNVASVSPNVDSVNAFGQRAKNGAFFSTPTAAFDSRQFQFGAKLSF